MGLQLEVVMAAQLWLTENHWTVHSRRVTSMVCELYLNKAVIKILFIIATNQKYLGITQ